MANHVSKATEYELFVQNIYRRLYSVEGIDNPVIMHNVTLTGKSGATHQIDVYWEFSLAGVRHRVAVECKDYESPIKKEKIASFKGVLDDIAGNIQGIYASRVGYQKGALQFAEQYGIQPMIIRKLTDEDWEGRIRTIYIDIHMFTHSNIRVHFEGDKDWINDNMPELVNQESGVIGLSGLNIETFIDDQDKKEIKSICEYQNELPRESAGKDYFTEYEYQNAYLICNGIRYKIKKFRIDYDVNEYVDTICIKGDEILEAIVKNSLESSEKLIGFDGRVHERK